VLVLGGISLFRYDASHPAAAPSSGRTVPATPSLLARLPLAFEPNAGQVGQPVKFLARGAGYGLYLTPTKAVLTLPSPQGTKSDLLAVGMQFAGANPETVMAGTELLPGHSNYFIGNDPSRWIHNLPQYSRVRYRGLYQGVDLVFYGNQGRLEYDFEVSPGADPGAIELGFEGTDGLQVASNGDLLFSVGSRAMRFQAPHIYQTEGNRRRPVAGGFVVRADGRAAFRIGSYDPARTLVIDPVLSFSTYLGGSGGESCATIAGTTFVPNCPAIAVDSASRVYLAGSTTSPGSSFPGAGASPPTLKGAADVFVARISSNGTALVVDYVTYVGGSGIEYPTGVGVDSGFNVYLAGNTSSSDFPTVNGFKSSASGNHAFVTKFDTTGSANLYSTYLAGSGTDSASALALDSQAQVYVFGTTTSPDFPTTPGALQSTAKAASQFFFSKLNPAQSGSASLLYSTFIGGSTPSNGVVLGGAVAVDSNLNVYLAGGTNFSDMPVLNAYQGTLQGGTNVWAAELKAPSNNTQQYVPDYETYLGGPGDSAQVDVAYGIASDNSSAYITGSTTSSAFVLPTGILAFQNTNAGGTDAFIAKLGQPTTVGTTQGTVPLNYFTYLGGSGMDVGLSIIADPASQNARVTGFTQSANFPNTSPLAGSPGGGTDAFFARLLTNVSTGSTNTSSTSLLGGSGTDIGTSIATDASLNSYVAGETASGNFPTAASPGQPPVTPLQASLSGPSDAFISKLGASTVGLSLVCPANATTVCTPTGVTVNPSPVAVGNSATFTYSVYNTSDPVNGVIFTDIVQGTNSQITSATANSSSSNCVITGGTSAVCNLGAVSTSGLTTSGSTTTISSTTTVTIQVTASAPANSSPAPPKPPDIGNTATLTIAGSGFQSTAGASASVNDFGVQASPALQTVTAGNQATYNITVTPSGPISESVSLGQCSGLPAQANCVFANNPIANLNSGAQSRTLEITTQPRVTTPASLFRNHRPFYAFWFPVSGLALIGAGVTRRRRWLLAVLVAAGLGMVALEAGCGSSSPSTSTTTGTPAGTYTVTLNATSGSATRSTAVTLVVQ
jgi:hypothetical protein